MHVLYFLCSPCLNSTMNGTPDVQSQQQIQVCIFFSCFCEFEYMHTETWTHITFRYQNLICQGKSQQCIVSSYLWRGQEADKCRWREMIRYRPPHHSPCKSTEKWTIRTGGFEQRRHVNRALILCQTKTGT